jgi:hypothetical protein
MADIATTHALVTSTFRIYASPFLEAVVDNTFATAIPALGFLFLEVEEVRTVIFASHLP